MLGDMSCEEPVTPEPESDPPDGYWGDDEDSVIRREDDDAEFDRDDDDPYFEEPDIFGNPRHIPPSTRGIIEALRNET